MRNLFVALLMISTPLFGQPAKKDSIWLPLKPFIGEWAGEGGGEPGKGKYERSYRFVLNGNFIEVKNKSTYEPTGQHPKGEVHEDIGYFSYDNSLRKFRLRQFHIEGFVNEFTLDSISPDRKLMVFVTNSIENIPKGWMARETYRFVSENEIEETFELAEPGKKFAPYSSVRLKRK